MQNPSHDKKMFFPDTHRNQEIWADRQSPSQMPSQHEATTFPRFKVRCSLREYLFLWRQLEKTYFAYLHTVSYSLHRFVVSRANHVPHACRILAKILTATLPVFCGGIGVFTWHTGATGGRGGPADPGPTGGIDAAVAAAKSADFTVVVASAPAHVLPALYSRDN